MVSDTLAVLGLGLVLFGAVSVVAPDRGKTTWLGLPWPKRQRDVAHRHGAAYMIVGLALLTASVVIRLV